MLKKGQKYIIFKYFYIKFKYFFWPEISQKVGKKWPKNDQKWPEHKNQKFWSK